MFFYASFSSLTRSQVSCKKHTYLKKEVFADEICTEASIYMKFN